MADRYFSQSPILGPRAELVEAEAHHLAHVMRAKPGVEVVLFDGGGCEFTARVEKIGRQRVELAVLDRKEVSREAPGEIVLGVSLPKGDRQKWMVEKLTEIGVARLIPLATARGVAQPADNVLARLQRSVIEASKQCGRNRLMEISTPLTWAEFLASAPKEGLRLVAHPDATVNSPSDAAQPWAAVWLAVGPEGGFTEQEIGAALTNGWRLIDLGPRILRVETAAMAVAARFSLP